MFRVEVKKRQAKSLCMGLISLCVRNFRDMSCLYMYLLICEWNAAFKTILSSLKTVSRHTF